MSGAISHHEAGKQRRNHFSPRGGIVLRLIVAMILLFAAGMKAWQLATSPSLSNGLLHVRWFNILVVEFELAFGIWLIFGLLPNLTRLVTIVLFMMFAGVSLYKALSGEASCGCFGAAQINPWWTSILDMAIIVALICCLRKNWVKSTNVSIKKIAGVVVLWVIVSVPFLYAFGSVEKNVWNGEQESLILKKSITLEPKNWVGKKCPLFEIIDTNDKNEIMPLKQGEWRLLLFHRDCTICQNLIQRLADSTNEADFKKTGNY